MQIRPKTLSNAVVDEIPFGESFDVETRVDGGGIDTELLGYPQVHSAQVSDTLFQLVTEVEQQVRKLLIATRQVQTRSGYNKQKLLATHFIINVYCFLFAYILKDLGANPTKAFYNR